MGLLEHTSTGCLNPSNKEIINLVSPLKINLKTMRGRKYYGGRYTHRQTKIKLIQAIIVAVVITALFIRGANAFLDMPKTNPYKATEQRIIDDITIHEPIPIKEVKNFKKAVAVAQDVSKIESEILRIAKENGFKYNPDYLVRLAYCESRHNHLNKNTTGNSPASTDRGLFQINSYWQKQVTDECAYDITCSTKWTIEKVNAGYQGLWVCDGIVKGKTKAQLGYNY